MDMKVLLMTPLSVFLVLPPSIPDLGLGYLATALRKNGFDVLVRDWSPRLMPDELVSLLKTHRPDVVGIKVFTKDASGARKTIAIIREILPEAAVVIGGPHPSACEPVSLMTDFDQADFAIRGEAEEALPRLLKLVQAQRGRQSLRDGELCLIPGLVFRGSGGVICNAVEFKKNLDDLGYPSWDLIDPRKYATVMLGSSSDGPVAPLVTTRGCPGFCTYCSAFTISGRKIRTRSPQNIFNEIRILHDKFGVRRFMFTDNCFTSILGNLVDLCKLIISSDMRIEWDCASYETLANLTDENLAMMRQAGCTMIHMGIETGSERIRAIINKRSDLSDISEKVRSIKRSGIGLTAWFMFGFPGECLSDMLQTIRYAFGIGADRLEFSLVLPLPGSAVCEGMKQQYALTDIRWSQFEKLQSPYALSRLSIWQLSILLRVVRLALRFRRHLCRRV